MEWKKKDGWMEWTEGEWRRNGGKKGMEWNK